MMATVNQDINALKQRKQRNRHTLSRMRLLAVVSIVIMVAVMLCIAVYLVRQDQRNRMAAQSIAILQRVDSAAYAWLHAQSQLDFCHAKINPPTRIADCQNPVSMHALWRAGLISATSQCRKNKGTANSMPCLLTPWGTPVVVEPAVPVGMVSVLSSTGAHYIRVWLPRVPSRQLCLQLREDMWQITPTQVQSDCNIRDKQGELNYYIEL